MSGFAKDRLWPHVEDDTVPVVKDSRGYLHAPDGERSERAVCGELGEYQDRPADHAGMWCTTCLRDAAAIE